MAARTVPVFVRLSYSVCFKAREELHSDVVTCKEGWILVQSDRNVRYRKIKVVPILNHHALETSLRGSGEITVRICNLGIRWTSLTS